jgi:ribosomal protein S18 acetylase RimI-like enzyme
LTIAAQVEILDIRHFNARQLRPLLEREAELWRQQLSWDYRGSTELLLQYLDSKVLPGLVALDQGRVTGFTFCVYEGGKAIIGDAFATESPTTSAPQVTRTLLRHLLELLLHTPTITRIESQLLLHDQGAMATVFTDSGFSLYPRLYMECDLTPAGQGTNRLREPMATTSAMTTMPTMATAGDRRSLSAPSQPTLPAGLSLRRWSSSHYEPAAALIHESYIGHLDAQINDQYRSMHGSIRFLHNIVRFPGCGVFEPEASWVVLDRQTGRPAGMILCSRISERMAHITQLCVGPAHRRAGLGHTLLRNCLHHLVHMGFEGVSLTVTQENTSAVRLYEEFGFFIRHRFDAMVLEKTAHVSLHL